MFKYAFIEEVAEATPENYSFVYENAESYNLVAGVSNFEMAQDLVKKLHAEGYELIDLCGAFDDEGVEKLLSQTKNEIGISHASYLPKQQDEIEKLESFKEFGVVIVMDGVEETQKFTLSNEDCNTCVCFTKDLDAAKAAAKDLTEQGVYFIELCSYFDKEKTLEVIDAIGGKIPVGSCGDLK